MTRVSTQEDKDMDQNKTYLGSVTYIGLETKKLIKCLKKYDVYIVIKKSSTIFDEIKNRR